MRVRSLCQLQRRTSNRRDQYVWAQSDRRVVPTRHLRPQKMFVSGPAYPILGANLIWLCGQTDREQMPTRPLVVRLGPTCRSSNYLPPTPVNAHGWGASRSARRPSHVLFYGEIVDFHFHFPIHFHFPTISIAPSLLDSKP